MVASFAVAGRFESGLVVDVAHAVIAHDPDRSFAGWGLVYCYGNRLEAIRSPAGPAALRFDQLSDIRTDMVMMSLTDSPPQRGRPTGQPFLRREPGQSWAFGFDGAVSRPQELRIENRIPDGPSAEERLFLHLLAAFDDNEPVESVLRAQDGLPAEDRLDFLLMNVDMLFANCRGPAAGTPTLWFGRGRLVRLVGPFPLLSVKGIDWEPVAPGTVLAIARFRRASS